MTNQLTDQSSNSTDTASANRIDYLLSAAVNYERQKPIFVSSLKNLSDAMSALKSSLTTIARPACCVADGDNGSEENHN